MIAADRSADGLNDTAVRELAAELARHYEPILGARCRVLWTIESGVAVLAVVGGIGGGPRAESRTDSDRLSLPLVWGLPIGANGEASDTELTAALADPSQHAAELLGSFVLVGATAGAVRAVTGADLVHTLTAVVGSGRYAWATKGWAALVAAGRSATIARDRVAEFVHTDQVWGGDELLEGTRLTDEALLLEVNPAEARARSWWPLSQRFGPGPPSTPGDVRELLTAELGRLAQVPALHLALTAGRDSILVASCLADLDATVAAYTIGPPGLPDTDGAARVADALGWEHLLVTTEPEAPLRPFKAAVTASGWTEGLDVGWNLIGPPLRWPGAEDVVLLSGSGGESGRAFYYGSRAVPNDVEGCVELLVGDAARALPPSSADALRSRLTTAVQDAAGIAGGPGPRALDVMYARTRMRSWLARTLPRPEARAIIAAYTSPCVTRGLLDLPDGQRRDGSGFDAMLDESGLALRALAAGPAPVRHPLDRLADGLARREGRVRGARRAGRLLSAARGRADRVGVQAIRETMRQIDGGPEFTVALLGAQWWKDRLASAAHDSSARRQLWNAISVEALARRCG